MESTEVKVLTHTEKELSKFDVTVAAIKELSDKYLKLKVNGISDVEGLKVVVAARKDVASKRIATEKRRKELNEDALTFQRTVNGRAKELTNLLAPIEAHLDEQEASIEKEKKRLQDEKIRLAKEKLDSRAAILIENGMTFNGYVYQIDGLKTDNVELGMLPDARFDEFVERVKVANEEIKRVAFETEALKKAEEERLEKQRLDLEAKQKELEEREKALKAQEQVLEKSKPPVILKEPFGGAKLEYQEVVGPKPENGPYPHPEGISQYNKIPNKVDTQVYDEVMGLLRGAANHIHEAQISLKQIGETPPHLSQALALLQNLDRAYSLYSKIQHIPDLFKSK